MTDAALRNGDIDGYMESNFLFHALIYRSREMQTLNRMIETLWMQFGPFMRTVYGRVGTANLIDQHQVAADAIASKDPERLHAAIEADIRDGMNLISQSEVG